MDYNSNEQGYTPQNNGQYGQSYNPQQSQQGYNLQIYDAVIQCYCSTYHYLCILICVPNIYNYGVKVESYVRTLDT